jgi:uncharacterized membrane protein YqiK
MYGVIAQNSAVVAIAVGAVIVFVIFISAVIAWKAFYKKAKADEAFVRTGMGGAKVFSDSGGFIVPLVHEVKWISLETMRLEVERKSKDALITNDKFRVDVKVEFYIRVPARSDQILTAARSLGEKSLSAESVKELVEAKLVGALRSVAATKNMIELHEDRDGFADEVQKALMNDLPQNGLNLESVSIVFLDQTDKDVLDPKNVFDAEGLKLITDATERARKEKNEIARRAEVAIKEQDVRAVKEKLELEKDQEYASAAQYKEVETYRAEREAETMKFKIEQEQAVREREITKERAISEAEIIKDQQVKEADISREQRVREADISKETYLISRQKEREETEIQKELAIEVAQREKEIGIIQKEKERELEHAKELEAVAEKEQAHQNVITVEKTAEADRQKQVLLIQQQADSEKDQIEKQIAADAAAYEVLKKAEATQKAAEMQAIAKERLAKAILAEMTAQADGEKKIIEAKNVIDRNVLLKEGLVELANVFPAIVREAMKPAEKISDIKVLNVGGMGGGEGGGFGANKVVDAFLQAGAALPMFKEMLRFADVDSKKGILDTLKKAANQFPVLKDLLAKIPEDLKEAEVKAETPKKKGGGKKA